MTDRTNLALLLLHALPFDGEMWAAQMSLWSGRTYAPNLYDFGSDIEVWAEQSLDLVAEKKVIVVGCSVGGSCALEIANLAPERIAALVLIGTKARHDPDPDMYQSALELLQSQGVEEAWRVYWQPLFDNSRDVTAVQFAQKIIRRQTIKNIKNGLLAFHNRSSQDNCLSRYEFPIHVMTGVEDMLPGIEYSRQLAQMAQNGNLHLINSCGHYVPMVKPNEFNTVLKTIIHAHSMP